MLLLLFLFVQFAQTQDKSFCNVRCEVDVQCGGHCNRCVTTVDNDRFCQGLSGCGETCKSDSDCDALCKTCINGACGNGDLPCQADCSSTAACGEKCGLCLPNVFSSNRTVCTDVCGAPCLLSLNCAEPCPVCSEDGLCISAAAFSTGEVIGIIIGASLLGGLIVWPAIICCLLTIACWESTDAYKNAFNMEISAFCIPVGLVVSFLACGLALGLSPSICCT